MKIEVQCCEGMERYQGQCLTRRCPTYVSASDEVDKSWVRLSTGFGNAPRMPDHGNYLAKIRNEISDAIEAAQSEGIVEKDVQLIARLSGEPKEYETSVGEIVARYEETVQNGRVLKWAILEGEAMKPKPGNRKGKASRFGVRRFDVTGGRGWTQQINKRRSITVYVGQWPQGTK